MNRSVIAVLSCVAVIAAFPAVAHPPGDGDHGHARTWTNARTGERIEGSFLSARGGTVALETTAGDVATIALSDLAADDRALADARIAEIRSINEWRVARAVLAAEPDGLAAGAAPAAAQDARKKPPQAAIFDAFGPFVKTRSDDRWLYVESDGLPHAPLETKMMVGIRAWQQQVPLPQPYTGSNAWQIPLKPELADKPVLGRTALMRGAVALAANGIPIFNALNNGGRDSYQIGELDEFGGHCGRGDDYHYHAAPLAIERIVGKGNPIAYALDGFPIHGLFDPKAPKGAELACPCGSSEPLDEINGHFCEVPKGEGLGGGTRSYHYHASRTFPYINGGLRGKVELEGTGNESQVTPQPRANGVRPALPPLRGASITGFEQVGPKAWSLRYEIGGRASYVNYRIEDGGKVVYEFVGPDGEKRVEEYSAQARRGGRGGAPPRTPPVATAASGIALGSAGIGPDGLLDPKHTCDGASVSPPFAWSGVPAGTKSIALVVHHVTPDDQVRVYLVRYGIPADATSIAEGDRTVGRFGLNNVGRRAEYAPPCSQGPGEKTYVATVYALSADPAPANPTPTRDELLAAMKDITLATGTLELRYSRMPGAAGGGPPRGGPDGGQRRGPGQGQAGGGDRPRGGEERGTLIARMTAFKTEVPAHDHDVVLVRPTPSSTTASIVASTPRAGFVEFWRDGESARRSTAEQRMSPAKAVNFVMDGLVPDATYRYRFGWRTDGAAAPQFGEEQSFETVRSPGKAFTFAVQADSHLDQGVTTAAYERTLLNIREEGADFLVDLGDTFMTDKRGAEFRRAEAQYDAQRYWFGVACRAMPLLMVLGNHDGEKGSAGDRDSEMPAWSYGMRTARFPAPEVGDASGGMFSGRTGMADGRAGNYYAFRWGDALFVVLDPFWSTSERIRGGAGGGPREPLTPVEGSWASTLGREQYDWLARTLAGSKAAHTFVFIHHLVGGMGGAESRGGVESVPYFEWGGKNPDGSDGFAAHRPGWPMPVHDLLVKHGVSAVFHGHDHLYVHGQRDGIHYQCVPQPGNLAGGTRSAADYGYASGTILGSPGHVRVRVGPDAATVEFVRTAVEGGGPGGGREGGGQSGRRGREGGGAAPEANGSVVDSYRVEPRRAVSPGAMREPQDPPPPRPDGGPRRGQGGKGPRKPPQDGIVKPAMSDTVHGSVYADNWFAMYVNGKLVAVDSIDFLPHNVVSLDILPEYPMTIAVLARDNADPKTGCEYGRQIGDGGFILKFADGTVTDGTWKARCFSHGPVNRDTANPTVRNEPLPEGWFLPSFDDSAWDRATEYSQERIDPKEPFFQHDFKGAKWIWTSDLDLDNAVVLRTTVTKPGWKPRWTTKPDLDVGGAAPH